jgi:hypothetical protein
MDTKVETNAFALRRCVKAFREARGIYARFNCYVRKLVNVWSPLNNM